MSKIIYSFDGKSKTKRFHEELQYSKTYISGLDKLCPEGIPVGNAVLIEGGPGSGKTILGLTLLKEACKRGKKVLYMSFEEREERLKMHMKNFGANPEEYEKKELLIEVQPILIPTEFKPDIVIMDSLTSISSAFSGDPSRFRIYMEQLFRYLEKHEITSFLIREVSSPTHLGSNFVEKAEAVSFLADGIIALYSVYYSHGIRKRGFEVVKMRGAEIDRRIVECNIEKGKGLVVKTNSLTGNYTLT